MSQLFRSAHVDSVLSQLVLMKSWNSGKANNRTQEFVTAI